MRGWFWEYHLSPLKGLPLGFLRQSSFRPYVSSISCYFGVKSNLAIWGHVDLYRCSSFVLRWTLIILLKRNVRKTGRGGKRKTESYTHIRVSGSSVILRIFTWGSHLRFRWMISTDLLTYPQTVQFMWHLDDMVETWRMKVGRIKYSFNFLDRPVWWHQ